MTWVQKLIELVAACSPLVFVRSAEREEAFAEMVKTAKAQDWNLAFWDCVGGLALPGSGRGDGASLDIPTALQALASWFQQNQPKPGKKMIFVVRGVHNYTDPVTLTAIERFIQVAKQYRVTVVGLSPVYKSTPELQGVWQILEHDLPNRAARETILRELAEDRYMPKGADLDAILDAGAGLTACQFEEGISRSLVRYKAVRADLLWEYKENTLKEGGLLEMLPASTGFAELGGLGNVKDFCKRVLTSASKKSRPRGVLLLGVPGTGKSHFARALAAETGRRTVKIEMGKIKGRYVGQSEEQMRNVLASLDSMGRDGGKIVAFFDEVEKALAGSSSGEGDSGVSRALFGQLLEWLSDHTSDVFVVMTANDVTSLLGASAGAFARAERFDGMFFFDFPTAEQKRDIWKLYKGVYGLGEQALPNDDSWTGAEIKSCCRLADLLGLSLVEAATQVVPVATTAGKQVDELRNWATGRCLSADARGLYTNHKTAPVAVTGKRRNLEGMN